MFGRCFLLVSDALESVIRSLWHHKSLDFSIYTGGIVLSDTHVVLSVINYESILCKRYFLTVVIRMFESTILQ